jgi:hypothetical protein
MRARGRPRRKTGRRLTADDATGMLQCARKPLEYNLHVLLTSRASIRGKLALRPAFTRMYPAV